MKSRAVGSVLGAALVLVACVAATPARAAAGVVTTRIEVAVDGFQNAPVQTFPAISYEGGVVNSGPIAGGGGTGKASLEEIVITKAPDGVSSRLLEAALSGRHLRSVTIRVFQRTQVDKERLVLEIDAVDVLVLKAHQAASLVPDAATSAERIALKAATVTFTYPLEGTSFTLGDDTPSV
jgi:type VI protein secretion system component Hcp